MQNTSFDVSDNISDAIILIIRLAHIVSKNYQISEFFCIIKNYKLYFQYISHFCLRTQF